MKIAKVEPDVSMTHPDGRQTEVAANSVEIMERQGWSVAKGSKKPAPVANEGETVANEERNKQDEAAQSATAADLKKALVKLGIEFKANAAKADLLALYLVRP